MKYLYYITFAIGLSLAAAAHSASATTTASTTLTATSSRPVSTSTAPLSTTTVLIPPSTTQNESTSTSEVTEAPATTTVIAASFPSNVTPASALYAKSARLTREETQLMLAVSIALALVGYTLVIREQLSSVWGRGWRRAPST